MSFILRLKSINPLFLISILFWIVCIFLFSRLGIKEVNDSARYLEYASNLRSGFYFEGHNMWYIGYVILIFFSKTIGESYSYIIGLQYLLSFISVIYLFKTSMLLWDSRKVGLFTVCAYILFVDILSWNSFILAESFYTSMICISLYYLLLLNKKKATVADMIIGVSIVLLAVFTKPTGIALLAAILGALSLRFLSSKKFTVLVKSIPVLLVGLALFLLSEKMLTSFLVLENYQIGEIIYAVTTIPSLPSLNQLVVTPPDNLYIPSKDYTKLTQIILFIWNNPIYWTELFLKKVFYMVVHIRPFWSWEHNLYSLLFLLPSYYLVIFMLFKSALTPVVKRFSVIYLLMHCLSVGLTSVDWDGRFLMPLLPVVFLIAGKGVFMVLPNLVFWKKETQA